MRFSTSLFLFLLFSATAVGQETIEKTLKRFNTESIPYIAVEHLNLNRDVLLLDAREKEEYEISHLPKAIWVGHRTFDADAVIAQIPKQDQEIVVYCSVGVRSETIGEKLKLMGYTDVKNLYGGIFEWKNKGNVVVDTLGRETEKVHAFSKEWAKLLTKGEKILN